MDCWLTWIVITRLAVYPACIDKGCICRMIKLWMIKRQLQRMPTFWVVHSCTICEPTKDQGTWNFDVAALKRVFWGLVWHTTLPSVLKADHWVAIVVDASIPMLFLDCFSRSAYQPVGEIARYPKIRQGRLQPAMAIWDGGCGRVMSSPKDVEWDHWFRTVFFLHRKS